MGGGRDGGCCGADGDESKDEELVASSSLLKPYRARHCTDVICLILFVLSLIAAVVVAIALTMVGDSNRLQHGTDFSDAICGVDLPESPYVYYPRLEQDLLENSNILATTPWALPLYGICVEHCPVAGDDVRDYICDSDPKLCKWERNPLVKHDETNVWHVAVATVGIMHRCFPRTEYKEKNLELCGYPSCKEAGQQCYDGPFAEEGMWLMTNDAQRGGCEEFVELQIGRTVAPPESGLVTQFVGDFVGGGFGVANDIQRASWEIIIFGLVLAIVLNCIVLCLLRCCIKPLFFITVVLLILLMLTLTIVLFSKAGSIDIGAFTSESVEQINGAISATGLDVAVDASAIEDVKTSDAYSSLLSAAESNSQAYLISAWISLVLLILLIVLIVMIWPKINIALEIAHTGVTAVFALPSMLLLPLISLVATGGAVAFFFYMVVMVVTPEPDALISALDVATTSYINISAQVDSAYAAVGAAAFEGFMSLWVIFFVDALVYATIAGATTYWYVVLSQPEEERDTTLVRRFPVSDAAARILRFHIGSMAMGSFVLALLRFVRYVLMLLDDWTKEATARSTIASLAMKCAHLCLWCFEKSVKFLTRFAYVFVATFGVSFCPAAVRTFRLVVDHPIQMAANGVASWVFALLQSFLTPLVCSLLAYASVSQEWRFAFAETVTEELSEAEAKIDNANADQLLANAESKLQGLDSWGVGASASDINIPPDPTTVAITVLVVSYAVTSLFKVVCISAMDTIFVCKFVDDKAFGGSVGASRNLKNFGREQDTPSGGVVAP